MANIKISELNEMTSMANNDVLPIVDVSADETKKIPINSMFLNEKNNSQINAYSCDFINNNLIDPVVSSITTGNTNITVIKIGKIVILNGILTSNTQAGTITLPYTAKYTFGFGFIGYYPQTGNVQAYGYMSCGANDTTLSYKANTAFTLAPINAIYYTDD